MDVTGQEGNDLREGEEWWRREGEGLRQGRSHDHRGQGTNIPRTGGRNEHRV